MLQSIRNNMMALQRQWAVMSSQPDGPTKTNAQQHLAAQMKRLQLMEQSAIQSMGGQIPPGAQLQPQQNMPQQPQQQQSTPQPQPNTMMPGFNMGAFNQMQQQQQSQPQMNGLNPESSYSSQQGDQQHQGSFNQQAMLQQQQQPLQNQHQQQLQQQQQQPPQSQTQQQQPPSQMGNNAGDSSSSLGVQPNPAAGVKRDFVGTVRNFMQQRGTPWPAQLQTSFIGPASSNLPGDTKTVELQALFAAVIQSGGSQRAATIQGFWAVIASRLGLKVGPPDGKQTPADAVPTPGEVPDRLAAFYRDRLAPFEQFWLSRMPQRQPSGQSGAAGSPASAQTPQDTSQQQQQQHAATPQAGSQNSPHPNLSTNNAQQQQQQPPQQQAAGMSPPPVNQPNANRPGSAGSINAANLPANLHQQMTLLQQHVQAGRITPQQARERFVAMQQAMRQAMMNKQQQNQQQSQQQADGSQPPPPLGSTPQPQSQQQQQPPGTMLPSTQSFPQHGNQSMGGMPPGAAQHGQPFPQQQQQQGGNSFGMPPQIGMPGQQQPPPPMNGMSGFNSGMPQQPPNQDLLPGGQLFNDPAAMLAQQQQQQQQMQQPNQPSLFPGQPGPDGVPQWPSQQQQQQQQHGPASPVKPNGAVPKTPKTDTKPQKKKRKKGEVDAAMPAPPSASGSVDVKPDISSGGGAAMPGSHPPAAGAVPPTAAPQPEQPVIPGTQQPLGPPAPPQKHKIEYLPIRRDVHTYGGWDLNLIETQFTPNLLIRGRPRTVRELGLVDVQGLTMSLRSRIDFEVAYALNTLLILSAGVGAPPHFQFSLATCEDLLDELLDLLEECSFQDEGASSGMDAGHSSKRAKTTANGSSATGKGIDALPTYRDWITAAAEEEAELKLWTRRKSARSRSLADNNSSVSVISDPDSAREMSATTTTAASSSSVSVSLDAATTTEGTISTVGVQSEHEQRAEKKAAKALTVLTILKNFSVMPDNMYFFNSTPRFFDVLAGLCRSDASRARGVKNPPGFEDHEPAAVAMEDRESETVFTTAEAFRVRKETLVILSNLAGEAFTLRNRAPDTTRTLFELLASFIMEASVVEDLDHSAEIAELAASLPPGSATSGANLPPVIRRIPYHADLALDALSKLALPDDNREILGELVPGSDIERLAGELVRMLPMTESDFKVLNTEPRLGYCERLAMCLYDLAFLAPPAVKLKLRKIPGLSGIILRIVKRLSKATNDFSRNPFSVLCRRLVEALRLISDGQDMFGAPPLLGFGFNDSGSSSGAGAAANSGGSKQVGLLLNNEDGVVEILLATNELDSVISDELHALLATG